MSNVLVIGDTHCPVMLPEYVDFLRDIYKGWQCDKVVHIGDVVDWSAISFHEKCPLMPSAGEEYKIAYDQVQTLHKAFPKVTAMVGNHDSLPARQAKEAGIPETLLRSYSSVWGTKGWRWMPRFTTYRHEGISYAHGDKGKGGSNAALANAKDNFTNWVQGHLHAQGGVLLRKHEYMSNYHYVMFFDDKPEMVMKRKKDVVHELKNMPPFQIGFYKVKVVRFLDRNYGGTELDLHELLGYSKARGQGG
jgi:predicted phosphodiesterase